MMSVYITRRVLTSGFMGVPTHKVMQYNDNYNYNETPTQLSNHNC